MPCPPGHPLDPAALHRAFETTYPLSWSHTPLSVAEISRLHGGPATRRSLQLLEQAAAVEPTVTSQFLDSLPLGTSPYQLDRRVKSPESLARKIVDWEIAGQSRPINDLLRYTVLTESPDELVAAACRAVDALNDHGWRVGSAMHSYTEGSRYKGIHAGMATAAGPRIGVEIQGHSRRYGDRGGAADRGPVPLGGVRQGQGADNALVRGRAKPGCHRAGACRGEAELRRGIEDAQAAVRHRQTDHIGRNTGRSEQLQ